MFCKITDVIIQIVIPTTIGFDDIIVDEEPGKIEYAGKNEKSRCFILKDFQHKKSRA